jgi:hypothetical protein
MTCWYVKPCSDIVHRDWPKHALNKYSSVDVSNYKVIVISQKQMSYDFNLHGFTTRTTFYYIKSAEVTKVYTICRTKNIYEISIMTLFVR